MRVFRNAFDPYLAVTPLAFFFGLLFVVGLLLSGNTSAVAEAASSDFFVHAEEIPFYDQSYDSLSKRMRWRRKIHGLRMAALDPRVWVMRLIDRTDNRVLIPIRPYFLKASIEDSFRLRSVSFSMRFAALAAGAIDWKPEVHAGVLDIGFKGSYVTGAHGRRAEVDRNYALRLSMFPRAPSGMLYRSQMSSVMLHPAATQLLKAETNYRVRLELQPTKALAYVDDVLFAEIEGSDLDRGLLSLTGGWHTLYMSDLSVRGLRQSEQGVEEVEFSGLVPTR